jgi:hypothetical protein
MTRATPLCGGNGPLRTMRNEPPCPLIVDIRISGSGVTRGWREASMADDDGMPRPDPLQEPNPEPASDASGSPRPRFRWTDLGTARAYAAQHFQREIPAARRLLTAARKAIRLAEASDDNDPHNRRYLLRQKALAVGFKVMGGGLGRVQRPPGGRAQMAGSRYESGKRRENRLHDRLLLHGGLQGDDRSQATKGTAAGADS